MNNVNQIILDPAKVLQYVQLTGALSKRAMDKVAQLEAQQKQASAAAPAVLQAMLSANLVPAKQKQAAEAALGSHAQTLGLLNTAVAKLAKVAAARANTTTLGRGEDATSPDGGAVKSASAGERDSLSSPFVGRRTTEKKASDRALLAGLGLNVD